MPRKDRYGSLRHRAGFTLVEPLVVMGLIALLTGILLPSIQGARGQAARVSCESNLRQLALASVSYSIENHDYLPFANWASANVNYAAPGWLYLPGTPFTATAIQTGALWPALRSAAVYECPSDLGPFYPGTTHVMTSYVMNGATCGFGLATHLPSFKVHCFRTDAIIYWETGASGAAGEWNDGASSPSEGLAIRHSNGGNFAAIDGHVDRLSAAAYAGLLNRSPGPLWCNPASVNGH